MKVDIKPEEIKALDELYKDAKCSIQVGTILGLLRAKLQKAINSEIEKQQKIKAREILGVKKD